MGSVERVGSNEGHEVGKLEKTRSKKDN